MGRALGASHQSSPGRDGRWSVSRNLVKCCALFSGHLFAHFPQTLQAAEFAAYCMAVQRGPPDSDIFSDCLNVVRQALEAISARLSYRRPHAGFMLQARAPRTGRVLKLKGHVADSPDLTCEQRAHKHGNDHADKAARLAAVRHPRPSPNEADRAVRSERISRADCKLAVRIMPLWPRLDLSEVSWIKPPSTPRPPPLPPPRLALGR